MKTKKWIAMVAALLCALQIAAAQAQVEPHHGFLLQKGVALTETLQKMAAFAAGSPDVKELAEGIAAGAFGEPDAAVIIELPEASLEMLFQSFTVHLMQEDPSIDLSLFDDAEVKEMFMARVPGMISNVWLSRQGYAWMMLSNTAAFSGMDDLPEGLSEQTYVALVYREAQVICLVAFSPNDRWRFVSYFAQFMPYDPELSTETIQELVDTVLPGWGALVLRSLRITALTGEDVSGLLSQ